MQFIVSVFPFLAMASAVAIPSISTAAIQKRGSNGYISSCSIQNFDMPFLSASCENNGGGQTITTINLNNCLGNDNGIIVSSSSGFTASCGSFTSSGQDFTTECEDESGGEVFNNIDSNSFIGNDNGILVC